MALKKISNINDELDIKLFLYISRKSLIYVIFLFILFLVSAFLYLRYTPPIFQTHSIIQLNKDEKVKNIFPGQQNIDDDLAKYLEIIKSPVFLKRAFAKLPLNISYFSEGSFLDSEQYKCAPYQINATIKDTRFYGPAKATVTKDGRGLA